MANQTTDYDPRTFKGRTFHDARSAFADGKDTPIAYLERCLTWSPNANPWFRPLHH